MLALLLSVQGAQTASVEHALSEAVPEQDAALEQWVAALEPVCEFTVTEDYPEVILELFDLLIEEENDGATDRRLSRADLRSLTVYGTREEFFADYVFGGGVGGRRAVRGAAPAGPDAPDRRRNLRAAGPGRRPSCLWAAANRSDAGIP